MCRVCGEDAATPSGTYCAEHKQLNPDRAPRAPQDRRPRVADPVVDQLQENLATQLGFIASMWSMRDPVCAGALTNTADDIARYWSDRARSSPGVARALENLTNGGGVVGLLLVHAPLLMAVSAHHVMPWIESRRHALAGEPEPSFAAWPMPPGGEPDDDAARAAAVQLGVMAEPNGAAMPTVALAPDDPANVAAVELVDLTAAGDTALSWESAMEAAAMEASAGIPFGMATYEGQPVWDTALDADDNRHSS